MNTNATDERKRILDEYERRRREIPDQLYAPWNAAAAFIRTERVLLAAQMLRRCGVSPAPGKAVCEVGYGKLGWLAELIAWGFRSEDLHGIELDAGRAEVARRALPGADLRVGDASSLPWETGAFQLVVLSTVLTSVLERAMKRAVADEVVRCLAPGGAVLWYDFAWNNPRNPNVRGIGRAELKQLFPQLRGEVCRVTLAPPIARAVAPLSGILAAALNVNPLLRTHLLAVLHR